MKIEWERNYIEQLTQLTTVTWDGDIISKPDRDRLVQCGYADRVNGFNFITTNGIIVLMNLGVFKI